MITLCQFYIWIQLQSYLPLLTYEKLGFRVPIIGLANGHHSISCQVCILLVYTWITNSRNIIVFLQKADRNRRKSSTRSKEGPVRLTLQRALLVLFNRAENWSGGQQYRNRAVLGPLAILFTEPPSVYACWAIEDRIFWGAHSPSESSAWLKLEPKIFWSWTNSYLQPLSFSPTPPLTFQLVCLGSCLFMLTLLTLVCCRWSIGRALREAQL